MDYSCDFAQRAMDTSLTPMPRDGADTFARFANADAMRPLFAQRLPAMFARRCDLDECSVPFRLRKVYAKPTSWHKSTFDLCYRLRLRDETGAQREEWLHAHAYLHEAARAREADFPWHWPELQLFLRRYTDDPALPQLKDLARPATALAQLARVRPGADLNDGCARVTVINYRPGLRCTLRYDLIGRKGPVTLFAKTYRDDAGAELYRRFEYCWHERSLLVAQPLGYYQRTVWQSGVSGRTPELNVANGVFLGREIGYQLRRLHTSALGAASRVSRAQLLTEAGKKARKLATAFPEQAEALQELLRAADSQLKTLPAEGTALLHGDLHLGQFLLTSAGLVWCDLDEMARGDAEFDIANLRVTLAQQSQSATAVAIFDDAFRAAYRTGVESAIDTSTLTWHARLHWLNRAYRAFLRCEPALARELPRLLAAALHPFSVERGRELAT